MSIPFFFIHWKWSDIFYLDIHNLKFEKGTYKLIENGFIINWLNNKTDTFIKYGNYYYIDTFYYQYIFNSKIIEYEFIDNEQKKGTYILNLSIGKIFENKDISKIGHFKNQDLNLYVNFGDSIKNTYIYLNNAFYLKTYIESKLIENNNNTSQTIKNNSISELYDKLFKIYDIETNKTIMNEPKTIMNEPNTIMNEPNTIINENYKSNIYNKIQIYKKIKDFEYILEEEIDKPKNNESENEESENEESENIKYTEERYTKFKNNKYVDLENNMKININIKNNNEIDKYNEIYSLLNIVPSSKKIVTLVEWAYPPYGGGENWILNTCKLLDNYTHYIIYFHDPINNIYYNDVKVIHLSYVICIQCPKKIDIIFNLIRRIDPIIIHHQGLNRLYYMKISNLLHIPFFTGFCFWQNIIEFDQDQYNVNMMNKNLKPTNEFSFILENAYTYVASDFVNDIIYKLYKKKLDVIPTISIKDDYDSEDIKKNIKKYVVLINCHYLKGGYLIPYLCENVDIRVSFLFIYTEQDTVMTPEKINQYIENRNKKSIMKSKSIFIQGKTDIRKIYSQTKILLTPSVCEETFCRVAYEGMKLNIPIISSSNGNLKYLLKDYAYFLKDFDYEKWKLGIEKLYFSKITLNKLSSIQFSEESVKKKLKDIIENIENEKNISDKKKYTFNPKHIGIIVPWADQGLGIQARDYYITFESLGYIPFIFSFKPYHATYDNLRLQTDSKEWDYKNVYYSDHYREDIEKEEISDFIYNNKISTIIVPEATFTPIFNLIRWIKKMNVITILVVNLECIRIEDLPLHSYFDLLLVNNYASLEIVKEYFPHKTKYIGFHLNHPYFNKEKIINWAIHFNPDKPIHFLCMGGLNSISRKNIDNIIKVFYKIEKENKITNWILNIYIQGIEYPSNLDEYNNLSDTSSKIIIHIENNSYSKVVDIYHKNDIFIHMGTHEGLGLGFYESLYTDTPVLTLDWMPNNEIIKNNVNGWCIPCDYGKLNDNSQGLIHKAIFVESHFEKKIIELCTNKEDTYTIIKNMYKNRKTFISEQKRLYEERWLSIL